MNKQNILKILDGISYLAIINATVFVLLFQNTASGILLRISLISYFISFLASIAFCFLRLNFASGQGVESEFYANKKQKIWNIIRLILSMAILGFVVFMFFVI